MKTIIVDPGSGIPKYRQIIRSVEDAIGSKTLTRGAKLPSINKICLEYSLSRDTVMLAYDDLKKRGIIYAIPGKGYYVKSTEIATERKIFLLFDELNAFKEEIYNEFLAAIGNNAQVDIFFHHFNSDMFEKLISESNGHYTHYVIMPTNLSGAVAAIKKLPTGNVFILDQTSPELSDYPAVYQNFVKDIYDALIHGRSLLAKYSKLVLIFPGYREPLGMKEGFLNFCNAIGISHEIISEFDGREISAGEVYVIPNDRDLVRVIEKSKLHGLRLGTDFGIISYNETPLKKVVENGITTISTDFGAMGHRIAEMVIQNERSQHENKCSLIIRKSL